MLFQTILSFFRRDKTHAARTISYVATCLLTIAALLVFQQLLVNFLQSSKLSWIIAAMAALALLMFELASLMREPKPNFDSFDFLTQAKFDEFAHEFIAKHFVRRWRFLTLLIGVFVTLGVVFFGFDAYQLHQQLRSGKVEELKKTVKESREFAKVMAQITVTLATYDMALRTPTIQQGLRLNAGRLNERKREIEFIQQGLSDREFRLMDKFTDGNNRFPAGKDHWLRLKRQQIKHFSDSLSLQLTDTSFDDLDDKNSNFRRTIEKSAAVDDTYDFVEPHLYIVDEIIRSPNTNMKGLTPNVLQDVGEHLRIAIKAITSNMYEDDSYRSILESMIDLNMAIYMFEAGRICNRRPPPVSLCAQYTRFSYDATLWKYKIVEWLHNRPTNETSDAGRLAHKRLASAKARLQMLDHVGQYHAHVQALLHRIEFIKGAFLYREAMDLQKEHKHPEAQKKLEEACNSLRIALKASSRSDVVNVRALNLLAWIYTAEFSSSTKRNFRLFPGQEFTAIKIAQSAYEGTSEGTYDRITVLHTYATALARVGFWYHATMKLYESFLAALRLPGNRKEFEELRSKRCTQLVDLKNNDGFVDKALTYYSRASQEMPASSDIYFKLGRIYQIKAITLDECEKEVRHMSNPVGNQVETNYRAERLSALIGSYKALSHSINLRDHGVRSLIALQFTRQMICASDERNEYWQNTVCVDTPLRSIPVATGSENPVTALEANLEVLKQHFPVPKLQAALLNNLAWFPKIKIGKEGDCVGTNQKEKMLLRIEHAADAAMISEWKDSNILHTLALLGYCHQETNLEPYFGKVGYAIVASGFCEARPVSSVKPEIAQLRENYEKHRKFNRLDLC